MLITKRFVMINFPKTGSSFAREAIQQAHQPTRWEWFLQKRGLMGKGWQELLMGQLFFNEELTAREVRKEAHGAYRQIPPQHRKKRIMSVVRDPLDRLVSAYEFRAWVKKPKLGQDALLAHFPHYPDLSFAEYFQLHMHLAHPLGLPLGMHVFVGPQTMQFIRMFARDPLNTMHSLREDTDLASVRDEHFPPITFLHTENLNQELFDFLRAQGYPKQRIAFILEKTRSNATARTRPDYLTPAIRDEVLHAERFLYQLFPEYLPTPPAHGA